MTPRQRPHHSPFAPSKRGPKQQGLWIKQMTQSRNTKSAKEETQKAQTDSRFFFVLLALALRFLCSQNFNSMPLR
jgi:hypothetical protein